MHCISIAFECNYFNSTYLSKVFDFAKSLPFALHFSFSLAVEFLLWKIVYAFGLCRRSRRIHLVRGFVLLFYPLSIQMFSFPFSSVIAIRCDALHGFDVYCYLHTNHFSRQTGGKLTSEASQHSKHSRRSSIPFEILSAF